MSNPKRIKLSNAKEKCKCLFCNKILANPVRLPCNILVCEDHTKNLVNNIFKCKSCLENHKVPSNGFIQDVDLKRKIDSDIHLTTSEREHKFSLNSLFEKMFELFDDFNLKFNEFEYFNHEHFAEIERQIEIRRERLKIKIDEISEEMLNKAKEKKCKFIEISKSNSINELKERIEREKIETLEQFRLLDFSIQAIQDIQIQQENNLKELQEKLDKFDEIKTEVKNVGFATIGDFDTVNFGRFTENLNYLVRVNRDNSCEIWNLETHACIKKIDLIDEEQPFKIRAYEVIDKTNLLTLSSNGLFRIFDLKSGNVLKRFGDSNLSPFNFPLISNKTLTFLEHHKGVNIYNKETGALVKSLKLKNKKDFGPIALLENGNILCTTGAVEIISLIDFNNGRQIKSFSGYNQSVEFIQPLPNNHFAAGSRNKVKIWSIDSGECIKEFDEGEGMQFWNFELTNDGKLICLYLNDDDASLIKIYDILNNYECIKTLHLDEPIYLTKCLTQNKLTLLSRNSKIRVYDLNIGNFLNGLVQLEETDYIIGEIFDLCSFF
jgi:WD40 repeat protein